MLKKNIGSMLQYSRNLKKIAFIIISNKNVVCKLPDVKKEITLPLRNVCKITLNKFVKIYQNIHSYQKSPKHLIGKYIWFTRGVENCVKPKIHQTQWKLIGFYEVSSKLNQFKTWLIFKVTIRVQEISIKNRYTKQIILKELFHKKNHALELSKKYQHCYYEKTIQNYQKST